MIGRFIITKLASEDYSFELRAGNGERIAVISQTFPTIESCENIIDSIRRNANAGIDDKTLRRQKPVIYPKFEIYRNISGEFYFRLRSATGEIIATSESYTTKGACIKGIKSIGKNAPECEIIFRQKEATPYE